VRSGGGVVHSGIRAVSRSLGLLLILGALGATAVRVRADPPVGGEMLLLDRDSDLGGTHTAVLSIDPTYGLIRTINFPAGLQAAHGLTWGPGKTVYVGDGPRIWAVDTYQSTTAPAREITHRFLFAVVDMVHTAAGRIFILDQFADPLEAGYSGAVLELDPKTEEIRLIASDPRFVAPGSIVAEAGGTLLVLDPWGRMEEGGSPSGAIFRIDPDAHTVTPLISLQFLAPATHPMAITLKDPHTLLLVDSDGTLPNHPPLSGVVYVISLTSLQPVGTLVDDRFRDPVDLLALPGGKLAVVDMSANPGGYTDGKGAIFMFDLASGQVINVIERSFFRQLDAVASFDCPDLDGSRFSLIDANGPPLRPGDALRFEVALVNRGPVAPGPVTLTVQADSLVWLFGTASAESGRISLDDAARRLSWEGEVGVSDSVRLQVDLRVPDTAPPGALFSLSARATGGMVDFKRTLSTMVETSVAPGMLVFVDSDPVRPPAPQLFTLGSDGWTPQHLLSDALLPNPVDIAFGPGGTLYILDATPGLNRVLSYDIATARLEVLHQGAPLLRPSGICLAHDGALLIADTRTILPGAIFRLDPVTRQMTTFYAEDSDPNLLPDPVDICADRRGHYLVTDDQSNAAGGTSGAIFEIDGSGHRVATYATGALFTDPFSAVVETDGSFFVTDYAAADSAASVIRVQRPDGSPPIYQRVAGPRDSVLVQPVGIERVAENSFVICDLADNPSGPGLGALVRLVPALGGGWRLGYQSYQIELRLPRRAAIFNVPELACSALELSDRNGGRLAAGDTIDVRATLLNRSPAPGLEVGAVLSYPPALHPLSETAGAGRTAVDDAFGTVHWSGDLAFLAPDTLTVSFKIDSLAAEGQAIELAVDMLGGLESSRVTVRDTLTAPLHGGEWIVLDAQANAFGPQTHGSLLTLDPAAGTLTPYFTHDRFVRPADVLADAPDRLLIVDSQADPLGLGVPTGAIFYYNPQTGQLRVFSAGALYTRPQRILPDPNGGWLVLDALAPVCAAPAHGAIFHVPPEGGPPTPFCCSTEFRKLADMAFDGQGHLWVSDLYANPLGLPTNTGAIFSIDLATAEVVQVFASGVLHDPTGLLWLDGRGLLFTDPTYRDPYGNSLVRLFNPTSGDVGVIFSSPYLSSPTRLTAGDQGTVWIADSTGLPPGSQQRGAVVHGNLATHQLTGFFQGTATRRLQALTRLPAPRPRIARLEADEDVAGHWHETGDSLHCSLLLVNDSASPEPWATLDLTLSPNLSVNPASIRADAGAAVPLASGFAWAGVLGGRDSVAIRYDAALTLRPGLTPYADHYAVLRVPFGTGDSTRLTHYISNRTGSGEPVIADSRATPRPFQAGSGALLRIEGMTRETVPIIADTAFASPVGIENIPGQPTEYLVVDADARRPGTTESGALMRASTRTGEVTRLFTDPTLVEPTAVVAPDERTAYLLDTKADPFNLRPGPGDNGPGAIYRIDLQTGVGSVLVSDTLFVEPVDLVLEPGTGKLLVIDRSAGAASGFRGSVFEVDPVTRQITPIWTGWPFVSLRCGALGEDGKLLVLDFRELHGATVYKVDLEQGPSVFTYCEESQTPRDMLLEDQGTLLVADATANPEGVPEPAGSILRLSHTGARCRLFATGAPLARPSGVTVRYDIVPVEVLDVVLTQSAEAVELAWTVSQEDAGAEYYVYRRESEDPASRFELLNPRDPVRGPGPVVFRDEGVSGATVYDYVIAAVFPDGSRRDYGPFTIRVETHGAAFFLAAPSPNPLTLRTGATGMLIRFGVPRRGMPASVSLIDVTGRCVRVLWGGPCREAVQTVSWDGRDSAGGLLGSGIYFLRLEAGARAANRRVVLIR
jgi:hypothetical protein